MEEIPVNDVTSWALLFIFIYFFAAFTLTFLLLVPCNFIFGVFIVQCLLYCTFYYFLL